VAALLPPEQVRGELPFVSSSALQFLELDRYATNDLKSRLYYLRDVDAAMKFTNSNVFEVVLPIVMRLRGQSVARSDDEVMLDSRR
jgi:hypothetical protein